MARNLLAEKLKARSDHTTYRKPANFPSAASAGKAIRARWSAQMSEMDAELRKFVKRKSASEAQKTKAKKQRSEIAKMMADFKQQEARAERIVQRKLSALATSLMIAEKKGK